MQRIQWQYEVVSDGSKAKACRRWEHKYVETCPSYHITSLKVLHVL